ncbi:MAG: type II toxin-antitoxin system RelE/ParE family toxin [Candidatus Electrothrix aestuarii]|uniref:Type II toxin-antitoxin system RelE/ParE family toxin n=1 Tax=Candidatus Electrothrix aestuarii TaxID=3062594 RepID=A0AAU8LW78_9BACT
MGYVPYYSDLLALPFKNYMIYYRCQSAQVEIVRVLHGSRDMGSIFNQSPLLTSHKTKDTIRS